ncbi:MAG TPA: hypothetical protein VFW50_42240 [Streptosporangiaceae bacterium]|nr:hypothetical protein [Streptosporangiaceae bacterium]
MTEGLVQLDAQWALNGKDADGEDYHILACSTGPLSRANFVDAISRFQLGAVAELPQVSVSYARLRDRSGAGYLALAIDELAVGGQRLKNDRHGRPITYTSYFCLPYRPLAERAISYHGLYEALRGVTLPQTSGPPLRVTLHAPAARSLVIDPLAMRVASLLLTGQPVCVLGAERTSIAERLGFIDAVMAVLPYGLRAGMTAATWTRATHRAHLFRLFFSSAPRLSSQPDHQVSWGEPDQVVIPPGPASDYLDWLVATVAPFTRLATLTTEIKFGLATGLQVLESAVQESPHPPPAPAGPAAQARPGAAQHASVNEASLPTPVQGDVDGESRPDPAEYVKPFTGEQFIRRRSRPPNQPG